MRINKNGTKKILVVITRLPDEQRWYNTKSLRGKYFYCANSPDILFLHVEGNTIEEVKEKTTITISDRWRGSGNYKVKFVFTTKLLVVITKIYTKDYYEGVLRQAKSLDNLEDFNGIRTAWQKHDREFAEMTLRTRGEYFYCAEPPNLCSIRIHADTIDEAKELITKRISDFKQECMDENNGRCPQQVEGNYKLKFVLHP